MSLQAFGVGLGRQIPFGIRCFFSTDATRLRERTCIYVLTANHSAFNPEINARLKSGNDYIMCNNGIYMESSTTAAIELVYL